MSGFAALILPGSRPCAEAGPGRALVEALRHRGPDGLHVWSEGPALLVQARLGGTAVGHDFVEGAGVRVAGDIRLDNAGILRRALGLPDAAPDAACIAAAYHRWGDGCCNRLEGDFAFALWDCCNGRLLAARDLAGVRPLYHAAEGTGLRLASEPGALARQGRRPLDDAAIVAYLAGVTECGPETGFVGVSRLAPGHRLVWQDGMARVDRYAEAGRGAEAEDAEAVFRAVFTRAVGDRLHHARRPAGLLSGGLDSSAICAVAAPQVPGGQPLRTYSLVHDHFREIDESAYIDAVLTRDGGRFAPTRIALPDHAPMAGVPEMMTLLGGPYEAPGLTKSMALYRRIAQDGCDVVLNGHGGDEVVGHGLGRITDLARAGRWFEAFALLPAACRLSGRDPVMVSFVLLSRYGPTHRGRRAFRAVGMRMGGETAPPLWRRCLREGVRERTRLADRMAAQDPGAGDEPAQHLATLRAPLVGRSFEILDLATARVGLEARYPFHDSRLVRLCLSLPSSERLRRHGSRSILRRALRDALPEPVLRRQDKTRFGPELACGLVRHHGDLLDRMASEGTGLLQDYLDPAPLRDAIAAMRKAPRQAGGAEAMFLWRAASMQLWFEMQRGRSGLAA